eukprot:scaffold43876_cov35-Tisochrysis_lutea.AAC.1
MPRPILGQVGAVLPSSLAGCMPCCVCQRPSWQFDSSCAVKAGSVVHGALRRSPNEEPPDLGSIVAHSGTLLLLSVGEWGQDVTCDRT